MEPVIGVEDQGLNNLATQTEFKHISISLDLPFSGIDSNFRGGGDSRPSVGMGIDKGAIEIPSLPEPSVCLDCAYKFIRVFISVLKKIGHIDFIPVAIVPEAFLNIKIPAPDGKIG